MSPSEAPLLSSALIIESALSGLTLCARQGSRRLRSRRRAADRRDRSHLGVRLRARLRHSRQGQGADAALGVLVRPLGDVVPHHCCRSTRSTFPAVTRPHATSLRGPIDAGAEDRRRCRSSAWRADICRDRAGRNTSRRARSAASRCPPGFASRTGCPSRFSRPRRRPNRATTRTSREAQAGEHRRAASSSHASRH